MQRKKTFNFFSIKNFQRYHNSFIFILLITQRSAIVQRLRCFFIANLRTYGQWQKEHRKNENKKKTIKLHAFYNNTNLFTLFSICVQIIFLCPITALYACIASIYTLVVLVRTFFLSCLLACWLACMCAVQRCIDCIVKRRSTYIIYASDFYHS